MVAASSAMGGSHVVFLVDDAGSELNGQTRPWPELAMDAVVDARPRGPSSPGPGNAGAWMLVRLVTRRRVTSGRARSAARA
jgi:hypothetical protein